MNMKWAQDKTSIFLSIEIPREEVKHINIEEDKITINQEDSKYYLSADLTNKIDCPESRYRKSERFIDFTLRKIDKNIYWDNIFVDYNKYKLTIDWNKWLDEDELDDIMSDSDLDFDDILNNEADA